MICRTCTRLLETDVPWDGESADCYPCQVDHAREALRTIAHDHAQHAQVVHGPEPSRTYASRALGWAQGIAREALGEEQNSFSEHFTEVRRRAHGDQHVQD